MKIMPKQMIDQKTNRIIHYIDFGDEGAVRPYVTQASWTKNSDKFIVGNLKTQKLYEYNIFTNEVRYLADAVVNEMAQAVLTPNNVMFYISSCNKIKKMNLDTYETEEIATYPDYVNLCSIPEVTNDGTKLVSYWKQDIHPLDRMNGENRVRIIPILDTKTGKWDLSNHHEFDEPFPHTSVGHPLINPVYNHLVFFCHEGTTTEIKDRLWILDTNTSQKRNLFIQMENEDGRTGETSGHEVWCSDGEHMVFVKYDYPQNVGMSGIVRIDKDGNNREYLNSDYKYWHCYPSNDNRYIVSDTQISDDRADIVLIDTFTRKSTLLCNFYFPIKNHPYQPHPVFSADGKKVNWQMVNEKHNLGVGWMDISDLIAT